MAEFRGRRCWAELASPATPGPAVPRAPSAAWQHLPCSGRQDGPPRNSSPPSPGLVSPDSSRLCPCVPARTPTLAKAERVASGQRCSPAGQKAPPPCSTHGSCLRGKADRQALGSLRAVREAQGLSFGFLGGSRLHALPPPAWAPPSPLHHRLDAHCCLLGEKPLSSPLLA